MNTKITCFAEIVRFWQLSSKTFGAKIQNTKNACLDGDCTIVFESLTTREAATEKQKEFKLCRTNCLITFSYILQKGFDLFDNICLIGFQPVYPKWVSGFVANRPAPDYGKEKRNQKYESKKSNEIEKYLNNNRDHTDQTIEFSQ